MTLPEILHRADETRRARLFHGCLLLVSATMLAGALLISGYHHNATFWGAFVAVNGCTFGQSCLRIHRLRRRYNRLTRPQNRD